MIKFVIYLLIKLKKYANMLQKYIKMTIFFEDTATAMTINLSTKQVENWKHKKSKSIHTKTADECHLSFEDITGKSYEYKGYVPDFFPGKHYGDYMMLDFTADGKLVRFDCTDEAIEEALAIYEEFG
jgi:hypothetical protein